MSEAQTGSSPCSDTFYFVLVREVLDWKHFLATETGPAGSAKGKTEHPTNVLRDVEVVLQLSLGWQRQ